MENIHVQNFISGGGVQNILFKGGPPSNFLAKKIFLAQKFVAKNKDSCFKAYVFASRPGQFKTRPKDKVVV